VSVVVWSAVIDDHVQLTTVAVGSMLYESGSAAVSVNERGVLDQETVTGGSLPTTSLATTVQQSREWVTQSDP